VLFGDGTKFAADLEVVLNGHGQLLLAFKDDIEKFLYAAPIRLAKHEGGYSWNLEDALAKEVGSLLDGMLNGRNSVWQSLGFIARCRDKYPNFYSRQFLTLDLRRRFYERRSAPRPGFQLTLEYARTLDGIAFEEWLTRQLRDAGLPGVSKTQASRDQGADIVVSIGARKIVIQAKNYQDTTGNKSVQEALGALHYYKATEAWVVTTSTFSTDAIDLAFHTGVHLVDGSRLLNLPELLLGPGQVVTELLAKPVAAHFPAAEVAAQSALVPLEADTSRTILSAPRISNGGTSVSDAIVAIPALPKSQAKGLIWRHWRLAAAGIGIVGLLGVFVAFLVFKSHEAIESEHQIQESSENAVRGLLGSYLGAERSRNAQLLADCFAPEVETFYLHHNVSRSDVLLEFQRSFANYPNNQKFGISQIDFSDVTEAGATATFDKEWDLRGTKNFAGAEREEMIFRKIDGSWKIVSERELKVYWTRRTGP
jgi:ketosteroid isomerase-like protein